MKRRTAKATARHEKQASITSQGYGARPSRYAEKHPKAVAEPRPSHPDRLDVPELVFGLREVGLTVLVFD